MDYVKVLTALGVKNAQNIGSTMQVECPKFGIVTDEDAARFLANIMNETGAFTIQNYTENLNYSTADRLKVVFPRAFDPSRFPNSAKYNPNDYLHNAEKLANLVYDDRIFNKGLGNTQDGDGFKFRGRGYIQVTGRNNYQKCSDMTGEDFINNPDLMATSPYALIGSLFFWKIGGCSNKNSLLGTRQVIAGNYTSNPFGIQQVTAYYNKIKSVM